MTEFPETDMREDLPGTGTVGVFDALGMGWRLLTGNFWHLWLVAFVALLLMAVCGCVPFGQFIATPPLLAGFFYVLAGRIDGRATTVGEIFEGFRQRFGQSIVSLLPVLIAWLVLGIIYFVAYLALFVPIMMSAGPHGEPDPEQFMPLILPFILIVNLVSIAMAVFQMFFMFAPLAVWDYPHSGWEAAKLSMRLVRSHFWSALGFLLLLWLISAAANVVGMLACGIGMFFTVPLVMVWAGGSVVYLYRSWANLPLVMPLTEAPPVEDTGPVPPADIEPPPPAPPIP